MLFKKIPKLKIDQGQNNIGYQIIFSMIYSATQQFFAIV